MTEYEVPLPDRPPAHLETAIDAEIIEDKFIYRVIFSGIQGALNLHFRAVVESIRNDGMREFFLKYLKPEIDTYGNLVKYGKMKGWTKVPPMYVNTK
jgi:hypothetical protein